MDSILPNSEPPAAGDAGPDLSSLRLALFSGNYNYVRDGANQALNRLVGYLLRHGAAVRVYSPVVETPAFPATGDLVDVPALPLPGRSEYRIPVALGRRARRDLAAFAPNAVHVSSPDFAGHRAVSWARRRQMAVLASVHTRFDTYPRYYNLAWIEPILTAILRRFYRRCDGLVAPSESMAQVLRDQRMNYDISLWSRGVDRDTFHPGRRDMEWRRSIGIADMAHAIRSNRPHRASGALAFHVLEVMEAFQRSSDSGAFVTIETRPERPAMLPVGLKTGELD